MKVGLGSINPRKQVVTSGSRQVPHRAGENPNELKRLDDQRTAPMPAAEPLPSLDFSTEPDVSTYTIYETTKVFQGVPRSVRLLVDARTEQSLRERNMRLDVENLELITSDNKRFPLNKWNRTMAEMANGWHLDLNARQLADAEFLTTEYAFEWNSELNQPVLREISAISTLEMFSALTLGSEPDLDEVSLKSVEDQWTNQEVGSGARVKVNGLSQESIDAVMPSIHAVLGEMLKARPEKLEKIAAAKVQLKGILEGLSRACSQIHASQTMAQASETNEA